MRGRKLSLTPAPSVLDGLADRIAPPGHGESGYCDRGCAGDAEFGHQPAGARDALVPCQSGGGLAKSDVIAWKRFDDDAVIDVTYVGKLLVPTEYGLEASANQVRDPRPLRVDPLHRSAGYAPAPPGRLRFPGVPASGSGSCGSARSRRPSPDRTRRAGSGQPGPHVRFCGGPAVECVGGPWSPSQAAYRSNVDPRRSPVKISRWGSTVRMAWWILCSWGEGSTPSSSIRRIRSLR